MSEDPLFTHLSHKLILIKLTCLVEACAVTAAVYYGLGNHMLAIIESGTTPDFLFWAWMVVFMYDVNVALGKIAAASFLIAVHQDACKKALVDTSREPANARCRLLP